MTETQIEATRASLSVVENERASDQMVTQFIRATGGNLVQACVGA